MVLVKGSWLRKHEPSYLTITNWRFFWSLHVKPSRILGGRFKKIEKFYKFSQKLEIIMKID